MELSNGEALPEDATIIFLVSGGKRHPPAKDGPCERIDAGALKCDDDGISVTCVDLFTEEDKFEAAALAAGSTIKVRKSGVVARITVRELREFMDDEADRITIVRDEQPHNAGHCLIKGCDPTDMGLQMLIAGAFRDFTAVTDIDGLVND